MEVTAFKRWSIIVLAFAMIVQCKSVSATIMTCHSSGKQMLTIGVFDACCASEKPIAAATFQGRCCDYSQQAQLFSAASQTVDGIKIVAPVIHFFRSGVDYFKFPKLFDHAIKFFDRTPPLPRPNFFSLICRFNL